MDQELYTFLEREESHSPLFFEEFIVYDMYFESLYEEFDSILLELNTHYITSHPPSLFCDVK